MMSHDAMVLIGFTNSTSKSRAIFKRRLYKTGNINTDSWEINQYIKHSLGMWFKLKLFSHMTSGHCADFPFHKCSTQQEGEDSSIIMVVFTLKSVLNLLL